MRKLAIVALFGCGLASRDASAQTFFYDPSNYSDFYGANLGNGVGLGYGIGVVVPPHLLNSSVTDTYVPPFQELCDSNPSFISRGAATPTQTPVVPPPPKKKLKVMTKKKNAPKPVAVKVQPVNKDAVK